MRSEQSCVTALETDIHPQRMRKSSLAEGATSSSKYKLPCAVSVQGEANIGATGPGGSIGEANTQRGKPVPRAVLHAAHGRLGTLLRNGPRPVLEVVWYRPACEIFEPVSSISILCRTRRLDVSTVAYRSRWNLKIPGFKFHEIGTFKGSPSLPYLNRHDGVSSLRCRISQ